MFHLVNKYGNVHKIAKNARRRDELIANGYTLVGIAVEEPAEVAAVDPPVEGAIEGEQKPKKGKTKKNAAEE